MRLWVALLTAMLIQPAFAQAPPMAGSFRNGANYTFELTEAIRVVDDPHDQGPIKLLVYVWKPLRPKNRVVLFSHGSTGGGSIDPREPIEYMPRSLLKFFVTRGYTVVMPLRRGMGGSGGKFIAECAFQSGRCTLADNRALARPALDDAVQDTMVVLDQVVLGKLVSRDGGVVFAGISRGGVLSLRMAAERPAATAAVVNFVGGWLSHSDAWPPAELAARTQMHSEVFRSIGAKIRSPTLWIYASSDPFYSEAVTRGFFQAYQSGGGTGRFVFIPEHALPIGHQIAQATELWSDQVDAFLQSIDETPSTQRAER